MKIVKEKSFECLDIPGDDEYKSYVNSIYLLKKEGKR